MAFKLAKKSTLGKVKARETRDGSAASILDATYGRSPAIKTEIPVDTAGDASSVYAWARDRYFHVSRTTYDNGFLFVVGEKFTAAEVAEAKAKAKAKALKNK